MIDTLTFRQIRLLGYAAGLVVVTFFGHDIVVVPLLNWRNDRIAWHAVKYGVVEPPKLLTAGGILRPVQEQMIKTVLQPQPDTSNFYFVDGERGVGKTTLVRQAAQAVANPGNERIPGTGFCSLVWDRIREVAGLDRWQGGGVLYAEVPGVDTSKLNRAVVGKALAESFRFNLRSYSWVEKYIRTRKIDKTNTADSLNLALQILAEQAARYRAKYGKRVTVIIDAFDRLPKSADGQGVFGDLLEWAKDQVGNGNVTAVFVCGEREGAHRARHLSAATRMVTVEVRDESDDAAREYMEKVLAKDIQERPQLRDTVRLVVANITGGRPGDVQSALTALRNGVAYDVMLKRARTNAQPHLEAATKVDLEHAQPIIDDAARLLFERDGVITRRAFDDVVKKHVKVGADDLAGRLLEQNVFALHQDETVTFQSRAMRTLLASKLNVVA